MNGSLNDLIFVQVIRNIAHTHIHGGVHLNNELLWTRLHNIFAMKKRISE